MKKQGIRRSMNGIVNYFSDSKAQSKCNKEVEAESGETPDGSRPLKLNSIFLHGPEFTNLESQNTH